MNGFPSYRSFSFLLACLHQRLEKKIKKKNQKCFIDLKLLNFLFLSISTGPSRAYLRIPEKLNQNSLFPLSLDFHSVHSLLGYHNDTIR